MKVILALETQSLAHEGKPHLATVCLFTGETYNVPEDVPEAIAAHAVELGWAEICESTDSGLDAFDPRVASYEKLKEFVRADSELDELIDLRCTEDDLRKDLIGIVIGDE